MAMAASSGVTAEAQHVEDGKKKLTAFCGEMIIRDAACMAIYGQVLDVWQYMVKFW